jgi:hypothetical protein
LVSVHFCNLTYPPKTKPIVRREEPW